MSNSPICFLTTELLNKITEETLKIFNDFEYTGFIYFDEPIVDNTYVINRVNSFSPFQKEKILPISWYMLKGHTLVKIYKRLKERKIYLKN